MPALWERLTAAGPLAIGRFLWFKGKLGQVVRVRGTGNSDPRGPCPRRWLEFLGCFRGDRIYCWWQGRRT